MRTAGIICEYNPFHMGHKKQIDTLHNMGYDCVVCIMSGNYTQRGELAIFDKYTRAKSAVLGGADLVLELPFPYSSFSAEGFAFAGVHMLTSLGIDAISFGSECGDIASIEEAAEIVTGNEFKERYSKLIKSGLGSTAAYFQTIKQISGNDFSMLSNDILGISYIAALKRMNKRIDIIPIKREGAAYNDKALNHGGLPSASAIRERIKECNDDLANALHGFIPDISLDVFSEAKMHSLAPVFSSNIGSEILSFFKLLSPTEIISRATARSCGGEHIAEDGCGICERLFNTARASSTFDEFIKKSYTSKYPDARINRVLLFSLFGVSDIFSRIPLQYTALLAANTIGCEFLSGIRKKSAFQIVTKPADAPQNNAVRNAIELSDSLYARAMPSKQNDDFFIKSHPFIQK